MPITIALTYKELLPKIPLIASVIVFFSSLIVIYGWFYNIEILKTWMPNEVNMKFSLAVCFLTGSVSLFSLYFFDRGNREFPLLIVPISSLLILFIMGTLLLAKLLNIQTGLESLFISEELGTAKTVSPGMPPIIAMGAFLLYAFANILMLLEDKYLKLENLILNIPIFIISTIALMGYLYGMPLLYFRYSPSATPVSFNTSIMFLLLSLGHIFLIKDKNVT